MKCWLLALLFGYKIWIKTRSRRICVRGWPCGTHALFVLVAEQRPANRPVRNATRPSQPLRSLVRRRRRHRRLSPSHANGESERGADAPTSPLAPTEGVFGALLPLPTPAHRSHSRRRIVGRQPNLRATYTATTVAATAATLRGRGRVADFTGPGVSVLSLPIPAIPPTPPPPLFPSAVTLGAVFPLLSLPHPAPLFHHSHGASDNQTPRPPAVSRRCWSS